MTCLEDTFHYLFKKLSFERDNFTIIHAIVERSSDGLRHPHAVIYNKITKNIHEVSNSFKTENIIMPFMLWVNLGNVSDIKQYSYEEMLLLLRKHKVYTFYHLPQYSILSVNNQA